MRKTIAIGAFLTSLVPAVAQACPTVEADPTLPCFGDGPVLTFSSDSSGPRSKGHGFSADGGPIAMSMTTKSLKLGSLPNDPVSDPRFRLRQRGIAFEAHGDLSPDLAFGLAVSSERTSRIDSIAPIFVRKTHSNAFELEGRIDWAEFASLRAGWSSKDGWGRRGLEDDAIRASNGETAASTALHVAVLFPTAFERPGSTRPTIGLDLREGSVGAGAGQGMRHANSAMLNFVSRF